MAFGSPDKFDGTSLYRDSSLYLQALIFRIGNTPHIIQYTIGEMAIKDAVQIDALTQIVESNTSRIETLEEIVATVAPDHYWIDVE